MIWRVVVRLIAAGAVLGGTCGALYILLFAVVGMVLHPDLGAIPAVLILTVFASVLGVVSGAALGTLNGLLVITIALPAVRFAPTQEDTGSLILLGAVAVIAGAVNFVAVRAVLNWWLSAGTITFVQFPLVFGWTSAVLMDVWVAWRVTRDRQVENG